jgi:hypothetical protein
MYHRGFLKMVARRCTHLKICESEVAFASSNRLQVGVRKRLPSVCPSAANWCGCRPEVQAHPYLVMAWLQIIELRLQSLHHRGLLWLLMQIKSPGALARSVTKLSFLHDPHAVLCIWEISVLGCPWLVAHHVLTTPNEVVEIYSSLGRHSILCGRSQRCRCAPVLVESR